ncbi:hypothetical protein FOG18_09975 [Legionella israelensis]|uniref:FliM/FliN family flagellar motor switch protein n=1 Tax=Legionella israelensis TaxID=454 RepID=UPI00117C4817|nr:FliM/FliN family flagellar motor switch protein [Legionella israelensis]QDP72864.1 hypothetical protein FOG18_09975 [Legionella israelensis]
MNSKDILTQDEIDALLRPVKSNNFSVKENKKPEKYRNSFQKKISGKDVKKPEWLSKSSVPITIKAAGTEMKMQDILQLDQGDVVKLEELFKKPVHVLVNGVLFAYGELLLTDGKPSVLLKYIRQKAEQIKD